ncbi:DUF362 domain-containing protein [bacterium]|nr:DUF362 domain-containing protein [bacterium]
MLEALTSKTVGIYRDRSVTGYDPAPPFGPAERYPEYPFAWEDSPRGSGQVYAMLRGLFRSMGLDSERFGRKEWNPLGEVIRPGDRVLVKPNWVRHALPGGAGAEALLTHPSLLRAVLDYVAIALDGEGGIVLGDSPMQTADFDVLRSQCGIDSLLEWWRSRSRVKLELVDFRRSLIVAERGDLIRERRVLPGDPGGYRAVNLGLRSYLTPLDENWRRYRVTDYNPRQMREHHNAIRHEYLVPDSLLGSDVLISLPKLKTHRKGGLTCALKNLVGINGNKDWLPHHRAGSPAEGGDEYPRRSLLKHLTMSLGDRLAVTRPGLGYDLLWHLRRLIAAAARSTGAGPVWEGSWYGNDTLWRMVLDLITIMLYGDQEGLLEVAPVRSHFAVVDAVVAGEGEGPLRPSPRTEGILLAGANPLAVDAVAASLAGLDLRRIPMLGAGFRVARGGNSLPLVSYNWDEIELRSNEPQWDNRRLGEPESLPGRLDFRAPESWAGRVELPRAGESR